MPIYRVIALSLVILPALLACGRQADPPVPSEPVAAAADKTGEGESLTSVYKWHARGLPAGETTIERAGDGRVTMESFVHWNNREYRLHSEMQLDADGMLTSQRITGISPFGATIEEQFSYADGEANWSTMGEKGSARAEQGAFYVATEWGASGSIEALVKAASRRIDGELPLFPAGTAKVEKHDQLSVPTPRGEETISLYSISGISFSPTYAWFDEDLNITGRDLGRMGMLPEGWDAGILETMAQAQTEQDSLRAGRLGQDLAHHTDGQVLIENTDVVDVTSGEILANYHVLIGDGKIKAISNNPLDSIEALRIDGSGKTMIPGLWDMHGHFSLDDGVLNIAGGITSVRDLGSTHERMMELQEKYDSGEVIGPTTYAGAMIDGLSQYTSRNPAETLEEALAMIDRFAEQGYIQIKLYSSIHPEWVPAIHERAEAHGLRLSGHVPAFMSAEQAVRAGYDEIQHINMVFLNFLAGDREDTRQQLRFNLYGSEAGNIDLDSPEVEALIDLFRENNVVIDPTAAIFDEMLTHVAGQASPSFAVIADHLPLSVRRGLYTPSFEIGEDRIADWAASAERQSQMIKKLHDSGLQLVPGSDDMPAFTIHRELELYVEAGISNAEVLRIATLDSAGVLGLAAETGSIQVGKASDLVLLDGNPLEDISAVRRGVLVIKGETLYRPDELYQAVGVEPFVKSVEL